MSAPLLYAWNGEAFEPLKYFAAQADKQFVIGQVYRLVQVEDRDMNSHRHYFACIHNAWQNVPERDAGRWPTSDNLRKWALTHTRFRTTETYEAKSKAEADRVAVLFLKSPDARVERVSKTIVLKHTPMSQSTREMSRRDFQESKGAVLDVLAELIGVPREQLEANTRSAA